ncbi:MAG: Fic family protein [Anaerolineaceae bacterium]|nr:MAG: Fic family protein [Anaerolineaceae bacterium]
MWYLAAMSNFTITRLESLPMQPATVWLLGECMQARGRQEMRIRQRPEVLEALREQAMIQSVESSNRIEGVTVAANRLRPIVLENAKPLDQPEEELAGYRKALDWIFSRKRRVPLSSEVVRKLHALAQGGASGDSGQFKSRDNEIIEILPDGEGRVRFVPTSAKDTPRAVEALCESYLHLRGIEQVPVLPLIAACVFDLLCIHPFRDGNGRVSRLLTTFLLMQEGFSVCRYISLERLVEDRKEQYYNVLARCSAGCHEGQNDIAPWWNYFLSVLRHAYGDFSQKVENASGRPTKSDLLRQAIMDQVGSFALSEILVLWFQRPVRS